LKTENKSLTIKTDMTKAQKQRFLELKSLGVDMNEAQQEEFDKLAETAVKSGLDLETLQEVDQSSLTEAELASVIKGCVQDELFGMSEQIQDRIENSATKEDLERAVKKYASSQINEEELVAKITKALPRNESLSKEDLAEAFKSAIGGIKLNSNHEYPVEKEENMTIEVPFGNRKGNLTIAQKQLFNVCKGSPQNEGISESQLRAVEGNKSFARKLLAGTGGTARSESTGAALVNTDISTTLEEAVYLNSPLAEAMRSREIQMPTNVFEIPLMTARSNFGVVSENASITDHGPTFKNVNLTSKKFAGRADYSYELDDDSVIAILPMLQEQLAKGASDALEFNMLSSGFVTKTSATPAVVDTVTSFDKSLLQCQATQVTQDTSTAVFSAVTGSIASARGKMGNAGIDQRNLVLCLTPKAYGEFVGDSSLITFDKLGDQATLLTGSVGQVFGINVIVSDNFPRKGVGYDLATNLIHDGTGGETLYGVLFNTTQFKLGVRGEFVVESDRDITTQQNQVVASFRRAFNVLDTSNAPAVNIGG